MPDSPYPCLDRQKKQHEQLASQLLGKNRNKKERRASAPGPGAVSKAPNAKPGSLASRIGVPKVRSACLQLLSISLCSRHSNNLRDMHSAPRQLPSRPNRPSRQDNPTSLPPQSHLLEHAQNPTSDNQTQRNCKLR